MKKLSKLGVVLLASGLLLTACAKSGNSSNSSSTTSKLTASEQKQLKQATSDYKTFVEGEIDQLLKDTEGFSETLKSGNLEEAKKQYPLIRMAYERSEPIAESFGESDVKIDYRLVDYMDENKSEDGWSGFHRIERIMWQDNTTEGTAAYVDQLVNDIKELKAKIATVKVTPDIMLTGAVDLLNEVATQKITGEEEVFSHTDLYDFRANIEGAEKIFELFKPLIQKKDAKLVKTLETEFKNVNGLLDKHMTDEKNYKSYTDLSEADTKELAEGAGLALGLSGASAFFANQDSSSKNAYDGDEDISFFGKHQAGITTPMQKACYLVVLDLHTTDKKDVIQLFKDWTDYSSKLVEGELVKKDGSNALLPPTDTGETVGLNPYRLSLTFGVSADFLKKLGLESKRPKLFRDLPPFPKEQLQDKYTGGDIVIQACADDEQVAFHAVRNLIRKGRNKITMKWSKSGFAAIGDRKETPRNLFGFKDGTANVTTEKEFDKVVWADSKDWMKGGSYMALRLVQMHLETWDRTNLQEQENTFGRYKESGAPFGKKDEFDEVDLSKLPVDSHVRLAKEVDLPILRRSYSYSDGIDERTGQFDSGLIFIAYQKDPDRFVKIQTNLGAVDKMNEYITHIGSGLFACFAGVEKGGYLGQALFE